MAERYSNYPYRDTQSNMLFSTLGPLLQSYMENKRKERELNKQYADQEIGLMQANPNMSKEEAQRLSRVNRSVYSQILRSTDEKRAGESRQTLAKRLGKDPAELEGLNVTDQGTLLQQQLTQDAEGRAVEIQKEGEKRRKDIRLDEEVAREKRRLLEEVRKEQRQVEREIKREQRAEKRHEKKQLYKRQVQERVNQGFSLKQAMKYAGRDVSGVIAKGLTTNLKRLALVRSDYINGKIDDITLETTLNKDPVRIAIVKGGATDPQTEQAIARLIGSEALQRAQNHPAYRKMPLIMKDYKVKSLTRAMGMPLGKYYEKPRKPGALEIEISKNQDRERRQKRIEAAKIAEAGKQKRQFARNLGVGKLLNPFRFSPL